MWQTIKPYLVGVGVALVAVVGFVLGRGRELRGDPGGVRDAIGDHDERARERAEYDRRVEELDERVERIGEEAEDLDSRSASDDRGARRTIEENREFIRRVRGYDATREDS